jgi:hypothetical protein
LIKVGGNVVLRIDRVDDGSVSDFIVEIVNKFNSFGFLKPLNANQLTFEKFLFLYGYEGEEAVECAGGFTERKLLSISRQFASELYPRWVLHLEKNNMPGIYRRAINYLMGTPPGVVSVPVVQEPEVDEVDEAAVLENLQSGGAIENVDAIHSCDDSPSGIWPLVSTVNSTPPPDYQSYNSENGSQAPLVRNEVLPEGVVPSFDRGAASGAVPLNWRQRLKKSCCCSPCCGGGCDVEIPDRQIVAPKDTPRKARFEAMRKLFSRKETPPKIKVNVVTPQDLSGGSRIDNQRSYDHGVLPRKRGRS